MVYLFPGDIWVSHFFQGLGDRIEPIMSFFTWLGYPQAYMVAVAVIYWSVDRKLGLRLALFLPVAASLNSVLKQAFHAPRPFWVDPEISAIRVSNGFGMPSGHAQASTVWLYAALLLKRRWFWIVAIVTAGMIGLSRIYLGVHFYSQVVAGWLTGMAVLILFASYERTFLAWFLDKKFSAQLLFIAGISVVILLLGALFLLLTKDWEFPREWIINAADDLAGSDESILTSRGLGSAAANCGGFLGTALGAMLAHRRGGVETGGTGWSRVLKSVAGLAAITAIYFLFLWISPDPHQERMVAVWQFAGFFVITLFVIFLYPLLYEKVGRPAQSGSK